MKEKNLILISTPIILLLMLITVTFQIINLEYSKMDLRYNNASLELMNSVIDIIEIDPITIRDFQRTLTYKQYEKAYVNDSFVIEVASFCRPFKNKEQVRCVVSYVTPRMNATMRNETEDIKSPVETIETGGICRDAYLLYAKIFKKLKWEVTPVFTHNHVYNNVYNDEENCIIDWSVWFCKE